MTTTNKNESNHTFQSQRGAHHNNEILKKKNIKPKHPMNKKKKLMKKIDFSFVQKIS